MSELLLPPLCSCGSWYCPIVGLSFSLSLPTLQWTSTVHIRISHLPFEYAEMAVAVFVFRLKLVQLSQWINHYFTLSSIKISSFISQFAALSELGLTSVDTLILSFPPCSEDDLTLQRMQPVWQEIEDLSTTGVARNVGVADLFKPQLKELHDWSAVKPWYT